MHCSRVRNLLSAYCDREVTGEEMLAIREHLGRCAACREEHEGVRRVKLLLGALSAVEPPRAFSAELLAARRSPMSRLRRRWAALAAPLTGWTALLERNPQIHPAASYLAVGGTFAVSALVVSLLWQPQPADTVSLHVPSTLAS